MKHTMMCCCNILHSGGRNDPRSFIKGAQLPVSGSHMAVFIEKCLFAVCNQSTLIIYIHQVWILYNEH